jgi:hypothetical protein
MRGGSQKYRKSDHFKVRLMRKYSFISKFFKKYRAVPLELD